MRKIIVVLVITLTAGAGLMTGAPAAGAAKKPDPCKVLKTSEIASTFATTVGKGTKSLTTPVTTICKWEVSASPTRPDGELSVHLMFIGAKAAYDALKNFGYDETTVPGVGKGYYATVTGSLLVLKGKTLVTVQGVFIDTQTFSHVDVRPQLDELMKIAVTRV